MDPLVSTEWLAQELGAADLIVFDCTYYLPTEKKDAAELFRAAHIPGAREFDIGAIADPDTELPHMVPTQGRFAMMMEQLGVSNSSRVVFYDQKGLQSAARGWWMMGLFGHDQASVLDGGLPKWLRERREVTSGDAVKPAPGRFNCRFRADRLKGLGDMMVPDGNRVVLDARASARFHGTAPEPRPGLPSGHMPGSVSMPSTELLTPEGTMMSPVLLRAAFASVGVTGDRPVVTTCGTGVTATILSLGLICAGLPHGAVYDGSWTEWAGRADTIKETT